MAASCEAAARAWLEGQGFAEGDLHSEITTSKDRRRFPMLRACEKGELDVCKWLHGAQAQVPVTGQNTVRMSGSRLDSWRGVVRAGVDGEATRASRRKNAAEHRLQVVSRAVTSTCGL